MSILAALAVGRLGHKDEGQTVDVISYSAQTAPAQNENQQISPTICFIIYVPPFCIECLLDYLGFSNYYSQ